MLKQPEVLGEIFSLMNIYGRGVPRLISFIYHVHVISKLVLKILRFHKEVKAPPFSVNTHSSYTPGAYEVQNFLPT